MTLFQRCRSEHGRHDFAVGCLAAGPNVFVECEATAAHGFSGPIESWASGVLYDNVTIDGGGLLLTNREIDGQGVGWAAANSRPLAVHGAGRHLPASRPGRRTGRSAAGGSSSATGTGRRPTSSSSPTACTGPNSRSDWGAEAVANLERRAIPTEPGDARPIDDAAPRPARAGEAAGPARPLTLRDGWLVCDGKLLVGGRIGTTWWRGHVLPSRAPEFGARRDPVRPRPRRAAASPTTSTS